jgi:hypothetical protein
MDAGIKREGAMAERTRIERDPQLVQAAEWSSSYRIKLYKESSRVSDEREGTLLTAAAARRRSG